jgi:hypothetical protein
MATTPVKKRDLPPKGDRNPDPITNEAGAHPIETGIGAAAGGAAAGMAAGVVGGPIGAAVGTVAGAVLGGLAGKSIGERIDPTIENQWLTEYYQSIPASGDYTIEDYRPAYRHGLAAKLHNQNVPFDQVEDALEEEWNKDKTYALGWDEAKPAVRHAYDRDLLRYADKRK